jgi:hypothetical protein
LPHCRHWGSDDGIVRYSHSNTLWAPFDNTKSRLAGRERYIEGGDGLAETFQCQAAEVFQWDGLFDRGGDATADQNLTVFRLGAEPSGEVAHGADRGVAGAFGKADLAERRITLRDANAKAQLSVTTTPCGN